MLRTLGAAAMLPIALVAIGLAIIHWLPTIHPLSEKNCARVVEGMHVEKALELLGLPNDQRETGSLLFGLGVNSDAGLRPDCSWHGPEGTLNVNLDEDRQVRVVWFVPRNRPRLLAQIHEWIWPSRDFINFQF